MANAKLSAEIRQDIGKNRSKKLREAGYLPGILYGKNEEPKTIKVETPEFLKLVRKHGFSSLIDLELEGEVVPVIIKETQEHPFKGTLLHVDFQKLNKNEKIKLTIPITISGREHVESVDAILLQQLNEIEIECFPDDIPQSIVADVSNIDLNTPFAVEDLDIAKNENITINRDMKDVIASLSAPTTHEEEEGEEVEEEEPEEESEE